MKTIQAQSAGRIQAGAGSLYAALDRMVRSGWIGERASSGDAQRRFVITRAGRAIARGEIERLAALVELAREHKLIAEGA